MWFIVGPDFGDFIAGVVPRDATWKTYEGRLKLDKGEKGRLRLPPWLKTEIPVGKSYAKIKEQVRPFFTNLLGTKFYGIL